VPTEKTIFQNQNIVFCDIYHQAIFTCLGSISPTCLRKAFMLTDPKSIQIQLSCQYLFALFGYAFVKALSKMLMKLTSMEQNRGKKEFVNFFPTIFFR